MFFQSVTSAFTNSFFQMCRLHVHVAVNAVQDFVSRPVVGHTNVPIYSFSHGQCFIVFIAFVMLHCCHYTCCWFTSMWLLLFLPISLVLYLIIGCAETRAGPVTLDFAAGLNSTCSYCRWGWSWMVWWGCSTAAGCPVVIIRYAHCSWFLVLHSSCCHDYY